MTQAQAQLYVTRLQASRRNSEDACAMVRRRERRHLTFVLLAAVLLAVVVVGTLVLPDAGLDTLVVWSAAAALEVLLWVRSRQVLRFLQCGTSA